MKLTLPLPPSANNYWRNIVLRTGPKCPACGNHRNMSPRVLLSSEAREYKARVESMFPKMPLLVGPLTFTGHVYRQQKRGDLSNRIKVTEDVLQGIAFEDDAQIEELHWFRHDDKANPRVEIEVHPTAEKAETETPK